jgi:hypothetical protein
MAYLMIKIREKALRLLASAILAVLTTADSARWRADVLLGNQIQELMKFCFFIAALAAIATFQRTSSLIWLASATLEEFDESEGRDKPTPLTRRRFLCFLFGNLAFLALALFTITAAALIVKPSIMTAIASNYIPWVRAMAAFLLLFGFWHLLSISLLGLYYLTDRLHRK